METIGINTRDFDWSILYDTVKWSTSTGQGGAVEDETQRAVSLNYREGSLYAPLEQYSYSSYLPQTILLLSGLRDGTNTVTARAQRPARAPRHGQGQCRDAEGQAVPVPVHPGGQDRDLL